MLQLDTPLLLGADEIQRLEAESNFGSQDHPADLLRAGTLSTHGVAVAGIDGYLFIGDGANKWERQYKGEITFGRRWIWSWRKTLEDRRRKADHLRIQLVNFVIPEKQVIIPHKRWPGFDDALGANRPVTRLLKSLRPDNRFVYPVDSLTHDEMTAPTYSRHDSHWSASGCCLAMGALLSQIGGAPRITDLKLNTALRYTQRDLTAHFFVKPLPELVLRLEPNGRMEDYKEAEAGRLTGSFYKLFNPDAPDKRRAAVFGDSYSFTEGVTYVLAAAFETVIFLWSKDVDWDLVAAHSIDVVVWEHAERFLNVPPKT